MPQEAGTEEDEEDADEAVDPDNVLGAGVPFTDVDGDEEDGELPVASRRPGGAPLPPPLGLHRALRSSFSLVWAVDCVAAYLVWHNVIGTQPL